MRYDELLPDGAEDDSAERLREPVPAGDVRPQPPPTPCGFHALVAAGDIVELYYDDGWWEVKVEAVVPVPKAAPAEGAAPAGTADGASHHFRVVSTMYAKWHTVPADMLRPQWLWAPAARAWRYELDAGHGCVAAGLAAVATFRFAHGISRRHNKSAFSVERPARGHASCDPAPLTLTAARQSTKRGATQLHMLYFGAPDDVVASDPSRASRGPPFVSPPRGWPGCFSSNKALKSSPRPAGRRCWTEEPSASDLAAVAEVDLMLVDELQPDDPFGNAERVRDALGWEVLRRCFETHPAIGAPALVERGARGLGREVGRLHAAARRARDARPRRVSARRQAAGAAERRAPRGGGV